MHTWHIDVSSLRLLNGTKGYIHAIIDNFSRKIMDSTVAARINPTTTCQVLAQASGHLDAGAARPTLMVDSGVENMNAALMATQIRRVLAQVEVTESNSMIEAWWRSLKHQWLFLNSLDTIENVRALVAFFVQHT